MTTCLLSAYLLSVGRAAPIGYGCASMNLTVGAVRGNVWGPAPGDVEEFLTIPYAVAPHRFDRSTPLPHGLPGPSPFDATDIRGHGENPRSHLLLAAWVIGGRGGVRMCDGWMCDGVGTEDQRAHVACSSSNSSG